MAIRAGFHYHTADALQCDVKINRYYELNITRKNMEPEQAMEDAQTMVEVQNSCNVIRDTPLYSIDGYDFCTCACNFVHEEFDFLYSLYDAYDNHSLLPFPGALTDQPAFIMEALSLLGTLKAEKELADAKRASKEQNRRR